ncbi:hypothetical protein HY643_04295, partial [Candidatus Woesearchaeota archaeon]|nr:hypothetical protein [Candidatus Woesearchaeota archaeon]
MGLNDVFEQAEKPAEEKNLQVIVSEESVEDETLVKVINFFETTKPSFYDHRNQFDLCKKELDKYRITPNLIKRLSEGNVNGIQGMYFSFFLSALIHTSYEQGFNDFELGEVNANLFGAHLQGQADNPIRIKAKKIIGNYSLYHAEHCSLTAEKINGHYTLYFAENCSLKVDNFIGDKGLECAENCIAEITNYNGLYFGGQMKNCKIYSPNQENLKKMQNNMYNNRNNAFMFHNLKGGPSFFKKVLD